MVSVEREDDTLDAWGRLAVGAWIAWFVGFCVFETLGKLDQFPKWPTFTRLVRRHVPASLLAAGGGWIVVHFIETYTDPPS